MELWDACLKGAIQGLTEFLPVSSTAHLILYDAVMKALNLRAVHLSPAQEECFDILLHIGTLGAVLLYYRTQWAELLKAIPAVLKGKSSNMQAALQDKSTSFPEGLPTITAPNGQLWDAKALWLGLLSAFFITSVLAMLVIKGSGVFFKAAYWQQMQVTDISEYYLTHPQWVLVHLAVTGLLLWVADTLYEHRQKQLVAQTGETTTAALTHLPLHITAKQAVTVGLFQCGAAVFHGISRSGSTLTGGLLTGLTRTQAAHFSFMLSAPIYVAVALYASLKMAGQPPEIWQTMSWPAMLAGTFVSFAVGYWCVKGFVGFVGKRSLKWFAVYCWLLSAGLALSGLIR